jgi:ankyrin repeat protein
MDKACIARLWRAAAEGLPIPAECIAYVTTRKLASQLVFVAVWNDTCETVLTLLELLSDVLFYSGCTARDRVNGVLPFKGVTALCYAAKTGSIHTARLLLRYNADVNHCGYGSTPMFFAASNDQPDFVRFLVDANADFNVVNDYQRKTALSCAAQFGCTGAVSTLLELKAQVDDADDDGWTPLLYAVDKMHVSCARLLVGARAQVGHDPLQSKRLVPLVWAASNGDLATATLLVEAKAAVNVTNAETQTPLWFAATQGHIAMGQLLLRAKANVGAPRHRPPLQEATAQGHADMVQLLLGAKACLS